MFLFFFTLHRCPSLRGGQQQQAHNQMSPNSKSNYKPIVKWTSLSTPNLARLSHLETVGSRYRGNFPQFLQKLAPDRIFKPKIMGKPGRDSEWYLLNLDSLGNYRALQQLKDEGTEQIYRVDPLDLSRRMV